MTTETIHAPKALRYRPGEINVAAEDPFENDRLGREPFIKATSDLLKAIQEPFVIALNGPWGSGKTTTLRMLEPYLATAGVTTVRFNAWEVDYATDPLIPLVAELHDRLLSIKGYGPSFDHAKVDRLKALGSVIAKHGAIAAVKIATAGFFDLGAAAEGIAKATGEAAEEASEAFAVDLIDVFKQERQAAQQFRSLLLELTACVRVPSSDGIEPPPLVLIIDELDRCRPTFAVAMLERIKHFFDVPGLVFVLALDLKQLNASIRKVYGTEFDATEYLRRFVDLELRLPRASVSDMVEAMLSDCGADTFFDARKGHPELRKDREWIVEVIKSLALYFELTPRLVQRMISRLMLVVRQTSADHYLDPIIVVFLIFLRFHDEGLLRDLIAGRAHASHVMEKLRTVRPQGQLFYDSHVGMLIEAYLLYAHYDEHTYVAEFVERVQELDGQNVDAASRRMLEVARRYEGVRSASVWRGRIDLRRIDERITLVATDLKAEG